MHTRLSCAQGKYRERFTVIIYYNVISLVVYLQTVPELLSYSRKMNNDASAARTWLILFYSLSKKFSSFSHRCFERKYEVRQFWKCFDGRTFKSLVRFFCEHVRPLENICDLYENIVQFLNHATARVSSVGDIVTFINTEGIECGRLRGKWSIVW